MTFRSYLALALFLAIVPASGRAADCVSSQGDYDSKGRLSETLSIIADTCGSLKIIDRRRDDARLQVNIYATYVVFDPPTSTAERRYNEWVEKHTERMNFSDPIESPTSTEVIHTLGGYLYRSPNLLSALVAGWICCGAHGTAWMDALNVNPETGRDVALSELIEIEPTANFCWEQFAQLAGPIEDQGKIFSQRYPREGFVDVMQRLGVWSVGEYGLGTYFGYLLGFVGAEFACIIKTEDLARFVRPGISVPP